MSAEQVVHPDLQFAVGLTLVDVDLVPVVPAPKLSFGIVPAVNRVFVTHSDGLSLEVDGCVRRDVRDEDNPVAAGRIDRHAITRNPCRAVLARGSQFAVDLEVVDRAVEGMLELEARTDRLPREVSTTGSVAGQILPVQVTTSGRDDEENREEHLEELVHFASRQFKFSV